MINNQYMTAEAVEILSKTSKAPHQNDFSDCYKTISSESTN